MKINDILQPGLNFTTPGGKPAKVIGLEKDQTTPPVWRSRTEYFGWVVTVRIDGELINIKFDTRDTFSGIKYSYEPQSKYRMKL